MNLEEDVRLAIEACLPLLPDDGAKEVRHYLDHGEPEMAFEGCMLELISANQLPSDIGFAKLCALARGLGLEEESVFDGEFWSKFCRWGEELSHRA